MFRPSSDGYPTSEGLPPHPPSPSAMCASPVPHGPSTPKSNAGKLAPRVSAQPLLAERYVLGQELGRGAHGHVYQALDKKSGQFVAVKQTSLAGVSKENLTSVMGEIELLKDLNHKHIVQYFDSVKTRNHLYIVLEYMENGSLANVIKPSNFGAFSEDLGSIYIAQVLEGLKYLHSQGVVHRDVKGANILTTKEGLVKLADFGVAAKLREQGSKDGSKSHHNTVAGTPYWMAPEVIELTNVTPAADIWSVGCLVIELLTGAPPYYDCQPIQALYRIVQDESPPFPHPISPLLEDFLKGCFHKEPSRRCTAEELLQHDWIAHHRMSLQASWSRNKGLKKFANESSKASVSVVVERILQHQARTSISNEQEQVPTPEISESPLGLFRTGSAPILPAGTDLAGQPQMPRLGSPLLTSAPSAQLPTSQEWNGVDIDQQIQNGKSPARGVKGSSQSSSRGSRRRSAPSVEDPMAEFDNSDTRQTMIDSTEESPGCPWLGSDIQSARGRQVPLATIVFSQHLQDCSPPNAVDPLSSAALLNTVGSQWNMHFGTVKSIQRIGPADTDRMEQLKMKKLVNNLWNHLPPDIIADSVRSLVVLLRSAPEKKIKFFAEGGIVGITELLYSTHHKVIEFALELVITLCEKDVKTLESLCAVGMAPAIFRFSSASFPSAIRRHAATFMEMMCTMSVSTLELFVVCQGIHWVAGLMEEGSKESTLLTSIALSLVEHLIKSHTALVSNSLCRLFSASSLPRQLVMSLVSMIQMLKESEPLGSPVKHIDSENTSQSFLGMSADGMHETLANSYQEHSNSHERHNSASGSIVSNPSTSGLSEGLVSYRSHCTALSVNQLADRAASFLLMLSTRDTIVRSHLCSRNTLKSLLVEVQSLYNYSSLQFKIVKALKNISCDPELLDRLQEAEAIEHLVPLLDKDRKLEVRREVLQLMQNLCKMNPHRREIAARTGIIPHLNRLANIPRRMDNFANTQEREVRMSMRRIAVEILCNMLTMSTPEIRERLWKHNILELLLHVVNEDQWQAKVLDGLAQWLEADVHQVEPKLTIMDSVQLLISILQNYRQKTNEVSQVLEPILRMLERSDKLSRQMGQCGLTPVIVDMLRHADAATCLKLLKALTRIYAMHPQPKEFIRKYDVQSHLHRLAGPHPDQGGEVRVLVRKHAGDLLRAFQMSQIW